MIKLQLLAVIPLTFGAILLAACQTAVPTGGTSSPPAAPSRPTATDISTAEPALAPTATEMPTLEPNPELTAVPPTTFSGQRAYEFVVRQTEFGFRPTGSAAGWSTGNWIIEELGTAGWYIETQEFVYQGVTARNIIGKSPNGKDRPIIILGAHYDTRRKADQDPQNPGEPVLGANDGASGTAVLLELASSLELDRIPYEVWLAFFDAEDNGNLDGWEWIVGSTYLASQLSTDPEFVIVIDMVGDRYQQIYYERNSEPELMAQVWAVANGLGYGDAFIPTHRHAMLDDHIPFARRGIPVVDIIDFDYPYWHTTGDTIDKVDARSLERVGRTVEAFLETSHNLEGANE